MHHYGVAYRDAGQGHEQERKLYSPWQGNNHYLRTVPCIGALG